MPFVPEDDVLDIPDSHKVVSEDYLAGKAASVIYHDKLNTLASYLQLPIQRCSNFNKVTEAACAAGRPFVTCLIGYMCYTLFRKKNVETPAPFSSY